MSLISLSTWSIFGWMSQGGHSEPLSLLALFYQSTPSCPSCLKVIGGGGGGVVVAHKILLSAPVPIDPMVLGLLHFYEWN